MNTHCDVCQTPLGVELVDDTHRPSSWVWAFTSMAITVAFYLPLWGLGVSPAVRVMSMFYGPLLASFLAHDNVVWKAALGGVFGATTIIVIAIAFQWAVTRATLTGILGGDIRTMKAIVVVVFGTLLGLLAILPLCLTGASVGQHLSEWRRRRFSPSR